MTVWRTIGVLWDRALTGDPRGACGDALAAAAAAGPRDRALLTGFAAFAELLLCRYVDGATTVERAVDAAPDDAQVRSYLGALRLLAAGMHDAVHLPHDADDWDTLVGLLDLGDPDLLLLAHPLIEAGMATGRFAEVESLVATVLATDAGSSSERVAVWIGLQSLRSLLFQGRLDSVITEGERLGSTPEVSGDPHTAMIVDALLCYAAAQRGERSRVEELSGLVLLRARSVTTYVQVGACLLVTWSLSTIGQVQRAAALLLGTAGGPGLGRIKTWDRAFGYELLAGAALQRGDLEAARGWVDRATPLERFPVAAAAVQRAQSLLAAAEGDHDSAVARAMASALGDSMSGSRIDELRSRVILASALVRAGESGRAHDTLGATARDADLLGATAVRRAASQQLRWLRRSEPGLPGGWESLTDRQREIAGLAAEGHSNRTIATTLFISERSVQGHVTRVLRTLGVASRAALPAAAGPRPIDEPTPLTDRQREVADLIALGLSNATIAERLQISTKTVEKHVSEIFERWDVGSRTGIARIITGARAG